jgi:hypothetical protein
MSLPELPGVDPELADLDLDLSLATKSIKMTLV